MHHDEENLARIIDNNVRTWSDKVCFLRAYNLILSMHLAFEFMSSVSLATSLSLFLSIDVSWLSRLPILHIKTLSYARKSAQRYKFIGIVIARGRGESRKYVWPSQ